LLFLLLLLLLLSSLSLLRFVLGMLLRARRAGAGAGRLGGSHVFLEGS
jgi:hypothetical protein